MKVQMKERKIPKRADGYPNFTRLGCLVENGGKVDDLFNVFTEAEIVELVNRALYQLDYQKTAHQKYQQRQRDWQAPVKAALKQLFPGTSWIKATPEQIEQAVKVAYPTSEEQQEPKEETR